MRYLTRKDKVKRAKVVRKERVGSLVYSVSRIRGVSVDRRYSFIANALGFSRVYFSQLRNRCRYTGSARSIWRIFHVSRMVFKSCAHFGWFFGVKRLAW